MSSWKPSDRHELAALREKAAFVIVGLVSAGVFGFSFFIRDGGSRKARVAPIFTQKAPPGETVAPAPVLEARPGAPTPKVLPPAAAPVAAVAASGRRAIGGGDIVLEPVKPFAPPGRTMNPLHSVSVEAAPGSGAGAFPGAGGARAAPGAPPAAAASQARLLSNAGGKSAREASSANGLLAFARAAFRGAASNSQTTASSNAQSPDSSALAANGAAAAPGGGLPAGAENAGLAADAVATAATNNPPADSRPSTGGGGGGGGGTSGGGGGGGGGAAGGAGVTGSVVTVPDSSMPPASKSDIAAKRQQLALVAMCLRTRCGAPGLTLTIAALQYRRQQLLDASNQTSVAYATLNAATGLEPANAAGPILLARQMSEGAPVNRAALPTLSQSEQALDAAIQCLQNVLGQSAFPENPPAADACHQSALNALQSAGLAAKSLDVQRQVNEKTLTAEADTVGQPSADPAQSARNAEQAARIVVLKNNVDAALGRAISSLGKAVSTEVPLWASQASDQAPGIAAGASWGARQVALTQSWAASGVLASGPDLVQLQIALQSAANGLSLAASQWGAVGAASSPDASNVTTASRTMVAALGNLNTADASLQNLAADASGTDSAPALPSSLVCDSLISSEQ
jgi:hypothetical protein